MLAPRINAAGRMGNAEQGLRLLLARDAGEARACAESLEEDNQLRREYDEQALDGGRARGRDRAGLARLLLDPAVVRATGIRA